MNISAADDTFEWLNENQPAKKDDQKNHAKNLKQQQ